MPSECSVLHPVRRSFAWVFQPSFRFRRNRLIQAGEPRRTIALLLLVCLYQIRVSSSQGKPPCATSRKLSLQAWHSHSHPIVRTVEPLPSNTIGSTCYKMLPYIATWLLQPVRFVQRLVKQFPTCMHV